MATIAAALAREVPWRVARYADAYQPDVFGEQLQRRGQSTALVVSGTIPAAAGRRRLRALNVVALVTALDAIAGEGRASTPSATRRADALSRR